MLLVDGNYNQWSNWSDCNMANFETERNRTCQEGPGKCHGESKEIRKCGEKYDPVLTMGHVDKGPLGLRQVGGTMASWLER